MPDVTTHPAVITAAVVITVLGLIAAALPRISEPIGRAIDSWIKRRRDAATAADDADIAERDRQIAYLQGVADERARELRDRDILIREHAPWDWAQYEAAIRRGDEVGHPPPLVPYIPPPGALNN